jgi:ankyrin repeat protein
MVPAASASASAAVQPPLLPPLPPPVAPTPEERLVDAATRGNVLACTAILASGVSPNARTRHGVYALYAAAANGNADTVELLLRAGASPWRSYNQTTPMQAAELLGARGADVREVFLRHRRNKASEARRLRQVALRRKRRQETRDRIAALPVVRLDGCEPRPSVVYCIDVAPME